jgi:hypothetical protein
MKVPFVAGLRSYHGPALLLVIELPAVWVRSERHLVQKKTVDTSCLPKFGRCVDLVWIKEYDLIRISNVRWSPMWK